MPADHMRFASAVTKQRDAEDGVTELVAEVQGALEGARPDVAFLFASSLYQDVWPPVLKHLREELGGTTIIGCTGAGVIGVNEEMEFVPGMTLCAAHLPDVKLHPFAIKPEDLAQADDSGFWIDICGANPADQPIGIVLPEPYTCDVAGLLSVLNSAYPASPLIGGLCSSAEPQSGYGLFLNDECITEGAVGLFMTGDIMLHTIVSQGCRPIGRPLIITKGEDNVIAELAGVPAVQALQQLLQELSDHDRGLAERALLLGVVMNEQKPKFRRGDFLIRNLLGLDPSSGALAVGERIHVGQTVQFQVRDADTSREDLQQSLTDHAAQLARSPSSGALLFSCLGRGKELYGEPHHDIRTIQTAIGNCPLAGFFCNGEIGPIGGRNFVHGFTSSLGLFRPRSAS